LSSATQLVEIIPAQAERDSGIGLKLFGFIAESVFAFIPEPRSESSRNRVHVRPESPFRTRIGRNGQMGDVEWHLRSPFLICCSAVSLQYANQPNETRTIVI
jgi:hypothetical protein